MAASRVLICVLAGSTLLSAQERPVPSDSSRVSIPGCARGRSFIVGRVADEPIRSDVAIGRRFRLAGPKALLDQVKKQEANMIEVTGLVKKAQLSDEAGVKIAGGRVRIGGMNPREPVGGAGRDTGYNEAIIDIESWRPLADACRER